MKLTTKHIIYHGESQSKIIELIVSSSTGTIIEDVTDLNGRVDEELIHSLRQIVNELEEQNRLVDNKTL